MITDPKVGDVVYVACGARYFAPGKPHVGRFIVEQILDGGRYLVAYAPWWSYTQIVGVEDMYATRESAESAWVAREKS